MENCDRAEGEKKNIYVSRVQGICALNIISETGKLGNSSWSDTVDLEMGRLEHFLNCCYKGSTLFFRGLTKLSAILECNEI